MYIETTMSFSGLAERYAQQLTSRGRRPATVRGYRSDLAKFGIRVDRDGMTVETIVAHLAWLNSLAPPTRARHMAALRSFLRWYDEFANLPEGAMLAAVLGGAARESRGTAPASDVRRPAVDLVAATHVLQVIPRQADRDQLFFGLLRHLGLRPGEALALNVADLRGGDHLNVPGRGGRRRTILISNTELSLRLENWTRGSGRPEAPLFPGPSGRQPVSYQAMLKRWNRYCAIAGVLLKPGDLREAHYLELLAAGVPLEIIGERLGLQRLDMTGRRDSPSASDRIIAEWSSGQQDPTTAQASPRRTAMP